MTSLWPELLADDNPFQAGHANWRAQSAEQTLARIGPLAREAGVTRLADITGLDWLGLPVFQAVRPASRNISVSLGKGLTPELSQASALMEALECYHAERAPLSAISAPPSALTSELGYPLQALPGVDPSGPAPLPDCALDWLTATNLLTGHGSYAPKELCCLDFRVHLGAAVPQFAATSNGLAGGNTFAEALLHGLCELVERDCLHSAAAHGLDRERLVDLDSISTVHAAQLVDGLTRQGAKLAVFDRTSSIGVPCYDAYLTTEDLGTFRGAGCHPDAHLALVRAVLESAQGRLAQLAGSRDDLQRAAYAPRHAAGIWSGAHRGRCSMREHSRTLPGTVGGVVRSVATAIRSHTGFDPLAVDLSRSDWRLPVVFCVAPGLAAPRLPQRVVPRLRPAPTAAAPATSLGAKVVVFVGPTISAADVREGLANVPAQVVIHPPAQQGDLFRLLQAPPAAVVLIDGEFFQVPAVLHKEVLALLHERVPVLGASSMGALRGAELAAFGMEGCGQVFERYGSAELTADDEVAVAHEGAEGHYRALTLALVNWRARLAAAAKEGVASAETIARVLRIASQLHFTERTLLTVRRSAAEWVPVGELEPLFAFLSRSQLDLKREDAKAVLALLRARLAGERPWPCVPTVAAHATKYSALQAYAYLGQARAGWHIPDALVMAYDSLVSRDFPRFCRNVKLQLLCGVLQTPHQSSEPLATTAERGRSKSRLEQAARRLGATPSAAWQRLCLQGGAPWSALLVGAAKRAGRFPYMLEALSNLLAGDPTRVARGDGDGAEPDLLLRRFIARRWGVRPVALDAAAAQRGFRSSEELFPAATLLLRLQGWSSAVAWRPLRGAPLSSTAILTT
ncbi:MAG: hypothetical protein EOO73_05495 [Myxococcales bacterium]|nr:MAG: hypothetical protein EOO73_05495 [Myxococcales bacterium]